MRTNAAAHRSMRGIIRVPFSQRLGNHGHRMSHARFSALYEPVLQEIASRSAIADGAFIDKDVYRVYLATFWSNVVLDPDDSGVPEADLEHLHDFLNEEIPNVLGTGQTVADCFKFITQRDGELAMDRLQLTQTHKELLQYFASMILDPDGHRRWMDEIRQKQAEAQRRGR